MINLQQIEQYGSCLVIDLKKKKKSPVEQNREFRNRPMTISSLPYDK